MKTSKYLGLILMILTFISCDKKPVVIETITSEQYAQGFEIELFTDYTQLIIKSPYPNSENDLNYFLVSEKTNLSQFEESDILIQIPIQHIVVTSTTHIPMLELLDVQNTLVGFPNTEYISSKKNKIPN